MWFLLNPKFCGLPNPFWAIQPAYLTTVSWSNASTHISSPTEEISESFRDSNSRGLNRFNDTREGFYTYTCMGLILDTQACLWYRASLQLALLSKRKTRGRSRSDSRDELKGFRNQRVNAVIKQERHRSRDQEKENRIAIENYIIDRREKRRLPSPPASDHRLCSWVFRRPNKMGVWG
jgi:hypothetical protein